MIQTAKFIKEIVDKANSVGRLGEYNGIIPRPRSGPKASYFEKVDDLIIVAHLRDIGRRLNNDAGCGFLSASGIGRLLPDLRSVESVDTREAEAPFTPNLNQSAPRLQVSL